MRNSWEILTTFMIPRYVFSRCQLFYVALIVKIGNSYMDHFAAVQFLFLVLVSIQMFIATKANPWSEKGDNLSYISL